MKCHKCNKEIDGITYDMNGFGGIKNQVCSNCAVTLGIGKI